MTPKTQSFCKHCQQKITLAGAFWYTASRLKAAIDSSDITLAGICGKNPKFSHEPVAEPASTGGLQPKRPCMNHNEYSEACNDCWRETYLAARPSEPAAPQTSAELECNEKIINNNREIVGLCNLKAGHEGKCPAPQPVSGDAPKVEEIRQLAATMFGIMRRGMLNLSMKTNMPSCRELGHSSQEHWKTMARYALEALPFMRPYFPPASTARTDGERETFFCEGCKQDRPIEEEYTRCEDSHVCNKCADSQISSADQSGVEPPHVHNRNCYIVRSGFKLGLSCGFPDEGVPQAEPPKEEK